MRPRIVIVFATLVAAACSGGTESSEPTPSTPAATNSDASTTTHTAVPEYVPAQCEGRVHVTEGTASDEPDTPASNPPLDTAAQLAVFDALVEAVSDFYLYPDFGGRDWPTLAAASRGTVEAGLETEAFYDEVADLVTALGDEHSRVESPSEVMEETEAVAGRNEFVGIGVLALPLVEQESSTILAVFPDSAAEHGGLQAHDSLLAVDGRQIVDGDAVHPELLLGPECSKADVTVRSPGGEPRHIALVRYAISAPLPIDARLVPTDDGSRVGYVFLPTMLDETIPGQVRDALEEFGELDGLIVDNRMNGGGLGSVFEALLAYFTAGTVGSRVGASGSAPLAIEADGVSNSQEVPLVVLIGTETVSYAEVFAGVLQDLDRATLVGEPTSGNVETLHRFDFADGSQLWLAQEVFVPPSGTDWEADGVRPDVDAPGAWDTFTFDDDPALGAALEVLGHEPSS